MKLKVNAFATLRDHFGAESIDLIFEGDTTVGDLKAELSERFPELKSLIARTAVSVDLQYAVDSVVLKEANEIALIPPVSGG